MVTKLKHYNPSAGDIESVWHVIDAKDKVLGRLASETAMLLMGKHRPEYVPHLISGDFVIIINAKKITVTGNKADQIVYRRHSQKPGKLKEIPYRRVQAKTPTRIIEHAVRGMLPKNKLGERMIRRLKVYAGEEHPHESQLAWTEQKPERDAKAVVEAEETAKKRAAARERAVARLQIAEDVAEKTAASDAAVKVEEPKSKKPATSPATEEITAAATVIAPEATPDSADDQVKAPAKKPAAKRTAAKKTSAAKTTGTAKAATSTRKKADSKGNKSADAKAKTTKPKAAAKKPAARASTARKKPATAKKDE